MQSPPGITSPDNLIHVANGVTGLVALAAFAGLLQPILGCIASLFAIAWFGLMSARRRANIFAR
jgi:hypothetical protein